MMMYSISYFIFLVKKLFNGCQYTFLYLKYDVIRKHNDDDR